MKPNLVSFFRYPNVGVIERGIELLLSRQLANGDFPQVIVNYLK